jgi:hypothetical protein
MSFTLTVDWDKDNNFEGAYDDITPDVTDVLEWTIGCRPFVNMADDNVLTLVVWNGDRKYSPEYSGSPLYGKLLPGRRVQLTVNETVMYTGVIGTIKPKPQRYAERRAEIECTGLKYFMDRVDLYPQLYENVTADQVIKDIATQIAVPPAAAGLWLIGMAGFSEIGVGTRVGSITDVAELDVGQTTFAYVGDNQREDDTDRVSAYDVISQLVSAERGKFFLSREGKVIFWNRHHLLNDTTPDVTIDNQAEDLDYLTPVEDLANRIEVTVYPRAESDPGEQVWSLDTPLDIPVGGSQTLFIPFAQLGGYLGAKDLIAPSDDDLVSTDDAALSFVIKAAAQRAEITISNSGSSIVTISTMIIRGTAITSRNALTYRAADENSIASYGVREMKLNLRALNTLKQAQNVAHFELYRRSFSQGRIPALTLLAQANGVDNANQLNYGMGDLVRIKDHQTGHDRNYHVIGEKHSLDTASKMHETTWLLEPAVGNFWLIGVAGLSEIGQTTRIGY